MVVNSDAHYKQLAKQECTRGMIRCDYSLYMKTLKNKSQNQLMSMFSPLQVQICKALTNKCSRVKKN